MTTAVETGTSLAMSATDYGLVRPWVPRPRWAGHTICIAADGVVSLRRPGGRGIAWSATGADADAQAREWLRVYAGATLDDRRTK